MPLPRSLANLGREISEKKWAEARQWAGGRTTKTKHRLPKNQKPDGGWEHQEDCLAVLPDQDGTLPDRVVPSLDERPAHPSVLVVPVPDPDSGAPLLQGVFGVDSPTENSVGGAEGDWEVGESVEDPGPPSRWEVRSGGAGLPLCHRCEKAGTG